LYSGVTDLLEFLKIKNIGMTICTQKNRETATVLLKKLKIYRFFDGYAFGDSTDFLKPDIRVFQYSVKGMGDANYFYIGDSFVDLSLAIKANANFIFHKNGYSGDLSQKVGVDYSFDTYDELQKFFSEYLDNR
jgi:phosphoglycolate phosphatase-like HAD superfamily hydrolase